MRARAQSPPITPQSTAWGMVIPEHIHKAPNARKEAIEERLPTVRDDFDMEELDDAVEGYACFFFFANMGQDAFFKFQRGKDEDEKRRRLTVVDAFGCRGEVSYEFCYRRLVGDAVVGASAYDCVYYRISNWGGNKFLKRQFFVSSPFPASEI